MATSAPAQDDKRHFQRIFFNAKAELESNGVKTECIVKDICLNGCLLQFESDWQATPDTLYTLTLSLGPDVGIAMQLSYAHSHQRLVGFKCENIDIDSITNLRRLVELNLGDSALVDRELSMLVANG